MGEVYQRFHLHLHSPQPLGAILVRTRPQRGGGGPLRTPKWLQRTMCFISAGGASDFLLGTRYGANFCFHHMCLYPKCSDFSGEFKNAQSNLLLLLGPLGMGTRQVKQFCLPLSFLFFFYSHASVWPLELGIRTPTLWRGPSSWGYGHPRFGVALEATFSNALEVLQCSRTITGYDRSQCVFLALSVCALGGVQRKGPGFGSMKEGVPPPYSPQNGWTPLGVTHWLAAAPVTSIGL